MKPMLACDAVPEKIRYPVIAQPKIDGIRALNIDGKLVGRSLKPHANKETTQAFSYPELNGLDGEMFYGRVPTAKDLCRATTSALNSINGQPLITWVLFDLVNETTEGLVYEDRYKKLTQFVKTLLEEANAAHKDGSIKDKPHLRIADVLFVMPSVRCRNFEEVQKFEARCLEDGYEGVILRDPQGLHKQGRSTANEGGVLRLKQFVDAEALVVGITEGQTNNNEAQTNELGKTFRTTHKENMVPNGQVGNLLCKPLDGGEEFIVSAGKLTKEERIHYFQNQSEIIGKIIKFKYFAGGMKDKPRFPTFQGFRAGSDIDEATFKGVK